MEILKYVSDACATLSATTSPSIDAIGLHMVLSLATIMMVWFGVQEALAAAQGGPGFSVGKFFNFFMLITFAYCFVKYFDGSIPVFGFSLKSFVSGGTNNLVGLIGNDTTQSMLQTIGDAIANSGPGMTAFTTPYLALAFLFIQTLLAILSACVSVIIAYGELGATVVAILGPVLIPFMVFEKTEFLFWGWLKAYIGFEFYKVVAAAVLSVVAHLFMQYAVTVSNVTNPLQIAHSLPILIVLVVVCVFLIFKIPHLTATLFSGSTGGHDGGTGIAMLALKAGL